MLPRLRSSALSSLRWIDKRAPVWLRRGVRRQSWTRWLAEQYRTREQWSQEYESSDWARLRTLEEFGRYSVIAGYLRRLGSELRVLDVGCGNGAMMEELHPQTHLYVGCDHAPPALRQALRSSGAKDALLVADATGLPFLTGSFDAVICNEVLYYLPDVPAAVAAMVRVLSPDGHLLVSMFDAFGREQSDCWEHLQTVCDVVDMVALTRLRGGVTWRIALLRPCDEERNTHFVGHGAAVSPDRLGGRGGPDADRC